LLVLHDGASTTVKGFGSDFGCFGARNAVAPAAFTRPRFSRKRSSDRMPEQGRASVRGPAPSLRRTARSRADPPVATREYPQCRAAAAMAGHKLQKLPRIALIAFHRFAGQASFA
jgi:hypothetical protein